MWRIAETIPLLKDVNMFNMLPHVQSCAADRNTQHGNHVYAAVRHTSKLLFISVSSTPEDEYTKDRGETHNNNNSLILS